MAEKIFLMNTPEDEYWAEDPENFIEDIEDFYRQNNEKLSSSELEEILNNIRGLASFAGYAIELNGNKIDFWTKQSLIHLQLNFQIHLLLKC